MKEPDSTKSSKRREGDNVQDSVSKVAHDFGIITASNDGHSTSKSNKKKKKVGKKKSLIAPIEP